MHTIILALLLAACDLDKPNAQGTQICDDGGGEPTDDCPQREPVDDLDAINGHGFTASEALSGLIGEHTVSPTWIDGSVEALHLTIETDLEDLTYRPTHEDCTDGLGVPLTLYAESADGTLAFELVREVWLTTADADIHLAGDASIGGTLDPADHLPEGWSEDSRDAPSLLLNIDLLGEAGSTGTVDLSAYYTSDKDATISGTGPQSVLLVEW